MHSAIHIGNNEKLVKVAVEELSKAFIQILSTQAGDDVKIAAINALKSSCGVEGTSINNCHFETIENQTVESGKDDGFDPDEYTEEGTD